MVDESKPQKTFVYVDGFNVYYGCVRGTRYKWLNLRALLERILTKNEVVAIHYFTALVKATPGDPRQATRQQTYIRALETLPGLTVEYGFFRRETRELRRADDMGSLKVRFPKEKGSDVNLATRLMDDFHRNRFEAAVVVSNDSDLAAPIKTINQEHDKPVGVMTPTQWKDEPAQKLMEVAAFHHRISRKSVEESQFPAEIHLSDGTIIHRPPEW